MGRTTELRQEIKRAFVPFALDRGFILDQSEAPLFLRFHRHSGDQAHLFDIQWEKYGRPRFVLNFAIRPVTNPVLDGRPGSAPAMDGPSFPATGRLYARSGVTTSSWFRQDKTWWERLVFAQKSHAPAYVVARLIELFPEVETYWTNGTVGAHLRIH